MKLGNEYSGLFKYAQARITNLDFSELKEAKEWTNPNWLEVGQVWDLRKLTNQLNYFAERFNCQIEPVEDGSVSFEIYERDDLGIGFVDFEVILCSTPELMDYLKLAYFDDEVENRKL